MSRLHVIYDPTDRLEVRQGLPKEIKMATMDVRNDIDEEDLNEIVDTLVHTLLEQWT